jgi:hypothetical protein
MGSLFFRRPDLVKRPNGPLEMMSCQRMASKTYSSKKDLPKSISFDRVCENRALPVSKYSTYANARAYLSKPCSLVDFMDYLVYIAFDAENLQFFLWHRDYVKRFNDLKGSKQASSPAVNSSIFPSAEGRTKERRNNEKETILHHPLPSNCALLLSWLLHEFR